MRMGRAETLDKAIETCKVTCKEYDIMMFVFQMDDVYLCLENTRMEVIPIGATLKARVTPSVAFLF